jgi:hypothetical protein
MAKSFKKFRDEWGDDEWGDSDIDTRRKDRRMESRRQKRRNKVQEKYSALDNISEEDS